LLQTCDHITNVEDMFCLNLLARNAQELLGQKPNIWKFAFVFRPPL